MGAAETLADLIRHTGLGDGRGVEPGETLREGPEPRLAVTSSLPHLTVGDAESPVSGGPDLRRIGVLGQGGMGIVWLAEQASLGRQVAVKQVRAGAQPSAAAALLKEARFMGRLEHPNIVPAHALGVDSAGSPVLVMKRVVGTPWSALLADPQHPWWLSQDDEASPLERNIQFLAELCRAVHHAHLHGVIHRDLKPDNVIIGPLGEVHLMDWGIAAALEGGLTTPSALVGTPAFMAPEMVEPGAVLGPHTDVYLLGTILHQILTGKPRHEGQELHQVLQQVSRSEPYVYGPDVSPDLSALANSCCARDPERRPTTALAVQQALLRHLRRRRSYAIAQVARVRLEALSDQLERGDIADSEKTFAECRFGFRQALDEAPDEAIFREGLVAALRLFADHAIAASEFTRAHALIDEISALEPEATGPLHQRLEAARTARLRRDATALDHDVDLHARERAFNAMIGAGALLAFSLSILYAVAVRGWSYDSGTAVAMIAITTAAVGAGLLYSRQIFWSNAVNRGLSRLLIGVMATNLGNRFVGWQAGTPVSAILTVDLLILALASLATLGIYPRYAAGGPVWLVGAVSLVIWPGQAVYSFGVWLVVGIVAMTAAEWYAPERP